MDKDQEIARLAAEAKRANTSLDNEIQDHTATKAKHAEAIAAKDKQHNEALAKLREQHAKEIENLKAQHAAAIVKVASESPEAKKLRELRAKATADYAARMKEAEEEFAKSVKG